MPIVLQKCDAQCFHRNDIVYISPDVLCTAVVESGLSRIRGGTKRSYIYYRDSFVLALSFLLLYDCVLLLVH